MSRNFLCFKPCYARSAKRVAEHKAAYREELKEHEPHVAGLGGIFVPQTGIVDYKSVARKYGELIQQAGAELRLGEQVIDIQSNADRPWWSHKMQAMRPGWSLIAPDFIPIR